MKIGVYCDGSEIETITIKGPKPTKEALIELGCEEDEECGTTFGYWHHYAKVAKKDRVVDWYCEPIPSFPLLHPNSPSCPPVKG